MIRFSGFFQDDKGREDATPKMTGTKVEHGSNYFCDEVKCSEFKNVFKPSKKADILRYQVPRDPTQMSESLQKISERMALSGVLQAGPM